MGWIGPNGASRCSGCFPRLQLFRIVGARVCVCFCGCADGVAGVAVAAASDWSIHPKQSQPHTPSSRNVQSKHRGGLVQPVALSRHCRRSRGPFMHPHLMGGGWSRCVSSEPVMTFLSGLRSRPASSKMLVILVSYHLMLISFPFAFSIS